jgi:alanine racemase
VEVWRQPGRPTRAVIDLDAIFKNVATVRSTLHAKTSVMAVVKANGYGHGATAVARAAVDAGATFLGVATVDEGVQLRDSGLTTPIVVLGPVDESEIEFAIGRGLELTIGDRTFAESIVDRSERLGLPHPVGVHVKVDTGMHRFGSKPEAVLDLARFVASQPLLRLRGLATHFAQADEEDEQPTADQAALFARLIDDLASAGISADFAHTANSAATLRSRAYDRDLVRLGIAMYGLNPSSAVPIIAGMRPAMTLISRIRRLSKIEPGEGVSYGAEYRATRSETVALVPIGYADGYRRALSNLGWMSVSGIHCPVRGRICMDQTVIGIPDDSGFEVGDTVIVAGASNDGPVPTLQQLADISGAINYEIASGIERRVPRFYIRGGTVVGIEDLFGIRSLSPPATNG